jgi:heat shock protein HslJ
VRTAVVPLVAAVAAALAAGCAGGEESSTEIASLEGVPWVLVAGVDVEGSDQASVPSATFDSGGVSGRAVCNSYASSYTVDGGSLELAPVAWTRIACEPPGDAVENAFFEALERVRGWYVAGDELVLVNTEGDELLRFEPAPET